jgi:ankyrin repeat protein
MAVTAGVPQLVEFLLASGVSVDQQTSNGNTPLHLAISSSTSSYFYFVNLSILACLRD